MSGGRPPLRHLLVIASQCDSMEPLERLGAAATELRDAMLGPGAGDCVPGLRDGRSLVTGDGLTADAIRALAGDAVRFAADRGAFLVLALLGHGFVPGNTTTLYFMGADSTLESTYRAVNVGELMASAANQQAISGVLGVIDTCHATGAVPPSQDLAAGDRNGRSRLALLMASSVAQSASDLAFSRALAECVRAGVAEAGPVLDVHDVLGVVRARLTGQDVTATVHDGDPFSRDPLWIARNAAHGVSASAGPYGPLAREEFAAAMGSLPTDAPVRGLPHDARSAEALKSDLSRLERSPAVERALRVVDSLLIGTRTVEFLRHWLGSDLTTARMRRALASLLASQQRVPTAPPQFTDVGVIDHLVFDYPAADGDCRRSLTRFVALLAQEAGRDFHGEELHRWACSFDAQVAVNDAAEFLARTGGDQQLRLVLSLHASLTGEWPETLQAWLLRSGTLLERGEFTCVTPDRTGSEDALEAAVDWAEDHAESLGVPLRRLDIAAPGSLLLHWRPEEAGVAFRLGAHYDLVLHWSRRLTPDWLLKRVQRAVLDRWEAIAACGDGVPVDWLGTEQTTERQALRSHLRNGRFPRGIGLTQGTGIDGQLLELLLAYTPVLLWPHASQGFPRERHSSLHRHWFTMPEGLVHAYRRRWQGEDAGDLAHLRAVWDDREWLRFCRLVRSPVPPVQTSPKESEEAT
ncbi:hypothetical protein ACFT5C_19540 [Streptomyces sp. NPDC057116]|uniref:vWA-MoxR associated conflict system protein n=1 Tax=Streptomyces sp. NPDC057116 TaxID=3346023 RepID=UPI00362D82BB